MKIRHALRIISALTLCAFLCAAPAFAGAVPEAYTSRTKVAFGNFATVSRLCVYDDFTQPGASSRLEDTWREVVKIMERVEQAVSVSVPTSDIARFNALAEGESVRVSELTATLVELSRRMVRETDGYFDPTVYPLVDLWGFSPRFTVSGEAIFPYDRQRRDGALPPPDSKYIEAFSRLVGMDGVVVEGGAGEGYRLRKATPSVCVDGAVYQAQMDLGGIAKGYVTDLVAQLLEEKGYQYGYFSCGSSSMRLMKSASRSAKEAGNPDFQLGVRKPRKTQNPDSAYGLIALRDQSLSSSGDYDNSYAVGDDIISHIISPFTGYPLNMPSDGVQRGIATVTLVSGSAVEDDAYTTALCLMGPERAIDYVNAHLTDRDVAMVFYRADQDAYEVVTNIATDRLTIVDGAYRLASEAGAGGAIRYTGAMFDFSNSAARE